MIGSGGTTYTGSNRQYNCPNNADVWCTTGGVDGMPPVVLFSVAPDLCPIGSLLTCDDTPLPEDDSSSSDEEEDDAPGDADCLPEGCYNPKIANVAFRMRMDDGGKKTRFMYNGETKYPTNPSGKWQDSDGGQFLNLTISTTNDRFCTVLEKLKNSYLFSEDNDDWRMTGISFTFTISSSEAVRWYVPPRRFGHNGESWNDKVSGTNGARGEDSILVYVGHQEFIKVYPDDHSNSQWDYDIDDEEIKFDGTDKLKNPHDRYYFKGVLEGDSSATETILDKVFPSDKCHFKLPEEVIEVKSVIKKGDIQAHDYKFNSFRCRGEFTEDWFERHREVQEQGGNDVFGDWHYDVTKNSEGDVTKRYCTIPNSEQSIPGGPPCPGAVSWKWDDPPTERTSQQTLACYYAATNTDIMGYEDELPPESQNVEGVTIHNQLKNSYCNASGNALNVIETAGNKTCTQYLDDFTLLKTQCEQNNTSQTDWVNCRTVLSDDTAGPFYETFLEGYCDSNPRKPICECYNIKKLVGGEPFCEGKTDAEAIGCTMWNDAYDNLMGSQEVSDTAKTQFLTYPHCFMPLCNKSDVWTPVGIRGAQCPAIQICQNSIDIEELNAAEVDFTQACNMSIEDTSNTSNTSNTSAEIGSGSDSSFSGTPSGGGGGGGDGGGGGGGGGDNGDAYGSSGGGGGGSDSGWDSLSDGQKVFLIILIVGLFVGAIWYGRRFAARRAAAAQGTVVVS